MCGGAGGVDRADGKQFDKFGPLIGRRQRKRPINHQGYTRAFWVTRDVFGPQSFNVVFGVCLLVCFDVYFTLHLCLRWAVGINLTAPYNNRHKKENSPRRRSLPVPLLNWGVESQQKVPGGAAQVNRDVVERTGETNEGSQS